MKILNKIISFIKEAQLEMKKVNWPSREETIRYTLIVIGISLAVAAFLGGLDYIFTILLNKFVL
ncbi:preprotein translocase subunit SecE [Candidatus Parcubacteria bacterium]|nr:preprotein translocase subunit SecE [Candidatus Parcubacteria bacterium]